MIDAVYRQTEAVGAAIRSFLREPTTIVLLFVLPPTVIVGFDLALEAFVGVPGLDAPPEAGGLGGALFATAFLAGLLGVFQIAGAAGPDRRLIVCGFHRWEVIVARILTIVLVGGVVAVVAFVTFWLLVDIAPASSGRAIVALLVAAVIYGLLGVIVGGVINRELEGSLVLVFLADLDSFLAIGVLPVDTWIDDYMPLARPYALFETAIYDGTLPTGDAIEATLYAVVLFVVALVIVRMRGGSS